MAFNHFPHVYQPIDVRGMHLKNRIQYSPIVSNHAGYRSGEVNSELFHFLVGQAKTGCSLLTIGSTPVDFEEARDFFGCLSVTSDDNLPGLQSVTREIHRVGCKLSAELTHAGQWAAERLDPSLKCFTASLVEGVHDPDRYIEVGRKEMDKVIAKHMEAIDRCKRAGFDQVMVHLGHGNLASSFLSPHFNLRTDNYGGSFENRVRFPLELLEAAREAAGDTPIEIRFVGNEWIENGMPLEERVEFLKLAQKYIDMVVVSAGTLFSDTGFPPNMPGYYIPAGCNVEYAAAYKEACPDLVISVCGGISTLDEAEHIISSGKADMVAMAKALMADSDYVNKGYRGQEDDIRPCLRCMYCLRNCTQDAHLEGCAVNPIMGWEYRGTELHKTLDEKKVMVVGGGPAGLEATRVLAKRGFETVLYEKQHELGGRLPEASALIYKDGFRRYLKWTTHTAAECGARIELGKEVTPDVVREENPDVLILACGAELVEPPIPGIDGPNVETVVDVDRAKVQTGKKVVVCGAGLSGAECALELAINHREVTLVDMIPVEDFYMDLTFFSKPRLDEDLDKYGVVKRGNCKVKEFTAEGVVIINEKSEEELLECDTAVTAFGIKPNQKMIDELFELVPEAYVVGDANHIGVIGDATNAAYWLAREL